MNDDHNDPIMATRATAGQFGHPADGGLMPCPFCGGEARRCTLPDDEFGNAGGDVIECGTCLASSRVEFGRKEHLEAAWNCRAIPTAMPDHSGDANKKVADLIERMERIVRSEYAHRDVMIHNCDLGQITFGDVRDLCDAIRALRAEQKGDA